MKPELFNEYIKTIIDGARQFMEDPSMLYGFRAYMLPGENQSRVFKLSIEDIMARDYVPPPVKGRFVAIIAGRKKENGNLILAFSEFPAITNHSKQRAALGYRPDELIKASKHLTDWIERRIVPVADGE